MRVRIAAVATVAACLMASGPAFGAVSLENAGFENPDIPGWSWSYFDSIPGWNPVGGCKVEVQDDPGMAQFGSQFVELNSNCRGEITQDVESNDIAKYRLTFLASPRPWSPAEDNVLYVSFGRFAARFDLGSSLTGPAWKRYSLAVQPDSDYVTKLSFRSLAANASATRGILLDDVRMERIYTSGVDLPGGVRNPV